MYNYYAARIRASFCSFTILCQNNMQCLWLHNLKLHCALIIGHFINPYKNSQAVKTGAAIKSLGEKVVKSKVVPKEWPQKF